jgi:hypothetical protein
MLPIPADDQDSGTAVILKNKSLGENPYARSWKYGWFDSITPPEARYTPAASHSPPVTCPSTVTVINPLEAISTSIESSG